MSAGLNTLIDRFHGAWEEGVIEVVPSDDAEPAETIRFTQGEVIRLLVILFPEEHLANIEARVATPTTAPPGTKRKILEMRDRVLRGEELFHHSDADLTNAKIKMRVASGKPQIFEKHESRRKLNAAEMRELMSLKGKVSFEKAAEMFGVSRTQLGRLWASAEPSPGHDTTASPAVG